MYTLVELESKTFGELKKIGWELNVLPKGDRRRRKSWIDAIADVNPPLLQLLENSPAEDVQAQESPIIETVEASPAGEVEQAQESIKLGDWVKVTRKPRLASGVKRGEILQVLRVNPNGVLVCENPHENQKYILSARLGFLDPSEVCLVPRSNRLDTPAFIDVVSRNFPDRLQELLQNPPGVAPVQKSIEVDPAQEAISQVAKTSPGVKVDPAQEAISQVAKTSPGVKVDPVEDEQFPECVACFDDSFVEDASGVIKLCQCKTEPKLSHQNAQRAIALAAEDSPGVEVDDCVYCTSPEYSPLRDKSYRCYRCQPDEADLNPILTGIALSDRFLARYAAPQSETLHYDTDGYKADTDGQLSLFEVHVQSPPEPPDPDDLESLDAFRDAIARWDSEHSSSSDHCSDHLPNSVQNEPPDPYEFDSMFAFWAAYDALEASDDDSELLEISLDSFCEWAPCPLDWYEPVDLLEQSEVSELSEAPKSSITSDFFIPTFGWWGDRSDRSDEPPDAGIFARLPKPNPPKFPPQASQPKSVQVRQASRNYPENIPKLFHCIVAGSSTQPARSPPGGDA